MSFREHCISSLFFHVIGVLLLGALSYSQMSGPRAMTVSLSTTPHGRSAAVKAQETREKAPAASPALAEEEALRTDKTPEAETAAEENPAASEPEKAAEVSQTAAPGMVAASEQDLSGLALMHLSAIHTRVFMDKAALSLNQAIHKEIDNDLSGTLNDGTAEVIFYFNDAGGIAEVRGSSSSDSLLSALGRLDWQSVPAPGTYRLKMKGLHVIIKIARGEPSFFFTLL